MPVPQKVGRPDVFYFILKKKTCEKNFLGKNSAWYTKKLKTLQWLLDMWIIV